MDGADNIFKFCVKTSENVIACSVISFLQEFGEKRREILRFMPIGKSIFFLKNASLTPFINFNIKEAIQSNEGWSGGE